MPDEAIEHVRREQPPWRRSRPYTECGLPVAGHPVITLEEFRAKVAAQGKQRAAFTTCMTCWNAALRNRPWDEDPREALIREAEFYRWPGRNGQRDTDQFRNELLAIAALIERHREEFDALAADLGAAPRLDEARARRRNARYRSG